MQVVRHDDGREAAAGERPRARLASRSHAIVSLAPQTRERRPRRGRRRSRGGRAASNQRACRPLPQATSSTAPPGSIAAAKRTTQATALAAMPAPARSRGTRSPIASRTSRIVSCATARARSQPASTMSRSSAGLVEVALRALADRLLLARGSRRSAAACSRGSRCRRSCSRARPSRASRRRSRPCAAPTPDTSPDRPGSVASHARRIGRHRRGSSS